MCVDISAKKGHCFTGDYTVVQQRIKIKRRALSNSYWYTQFQEERGKIGRPIWSSAWNSPCGGMRGRTPSVIMPHPAVTQSPHLSAFQPLAFRPECPTASASMCEWHSVDLLLAMGDGPWSRITLTQNAEWRCATLWKMAWKTEHGNTAHRSVSSQPSSVAVDGQRFQSLQMGTIPH
jgi:hypothetical protein